MLRMHVKSKKQSLDEKGNVNGEKEQEQNGGGDQSAKNKIIRKSDGRRNSLSQFLFGAAENGGEKGDISRKMSEEAPKRLKEVKIGEEMNQCRPRPVAIRYNEGLCALSSHPSSHQQQSSLSSSHPTRRPKLISSRSITAEPPPLLHRYSKRKDSLQQPKKRGSLACLFQPNNKDKEQAAGLRRAADEVGSRWGGAASGTMRTKMHVVVLGPKKVGKTTLLKTMAGQHDLRPSTSSSDDDYVPTIEDTFHIQLTGQRPNSSRELFLFHDTAGISDFGSIEVRKPYLQVADSFLLVFSLNDPATFNRIDALKKYLDKEKIVGGKDRKEIPIVAVGIKSDLPGRTAEVDPGFALQWAAREKVKFFETSARDLESVAEIVQYLNAKFFHSTKETKFSLGRKLKPEKSNAQIVMDF